MKKLIIGAVAVGVLGLGACSSSEPTASSSSTTTAAAGSSSDGGSSSSGGAEGDGGSNAASRDLCADVTAADVQALTGETITSAEPLAGGMRFRSGFEGPSCVYSTTTGLGGVSAEFVSADSYQGLTTDPVTKPVPLDGVGDEAFQVVDQIDGTKVIRTFATSGDEYLFVQIYAGTSEANAAALTSSLLG